MGEFAVDLTQENMHWWKFRVLLGCLSERCLFSKIVGYRTVDTTAIKDKEQRRFYEKMKKQFALKAWDNSDLREEKLVESLGLAFE